ncbi:MAG: methylated-DNA--[protein]-cysteine S-methyltransferase [Phycisphaerales bacterium]|nr:methylated-DNA--[protein]-cysteine S-methyltransferase [Phycisphaerales bacterium]MCB9840249.1 methylated-DNA--[protein]-cysteine S-methyltransferase [Phycisphaeraceae bacterium]
MGDGQRQHGRSARGQGAAPTFVLDVAAWPLGRVVAEIGEDGVHALSLFEADAAPPELGSSGALLQTARGHVERLRDELDAYFAGRCDAFTVPLAAPGTPFQAEVWAALGRIPAGVTRSYGDLARSLGRPTAFRAVARANATNPIALLVPCHRVIGSDGSLTGYAGGLAIKRWLLGHEARFWGHRSGGDRTPSPSDSLFAGVA